MGLLWLLLRGFIPRVEKKKPSKAWLSEQELKRFGKVGKNVLVSKLALVMRAENIELGDNVRIDAFTTLLGSKGKIKIGSHVHISTHCLFIGGGGITLGDYTNVASHCRLISASDDFSGEYLIGPMSPEGTTKVKFAAIVMEDFSVLGTGCTVLPGITVRKGVAVAAHSLLNKEFNEFTIIGGTPAKFLALRSKRCIDLANAAAKEDPES